MFLCKVCLTVTYCINTTRITHIKILTYLSLYSTVYSPKGYDVLEHKCTCVFETHCISYGFISWAILYTQCY